jgi:glycosyltransferase involved in cell wall biosynthesis
VYDRSSVIGAIVKDTRIRDKKVLVSGMPHLHTMGLFIENTNVAYTTFETTRIANYWFQALNEFYDYCIVPHDYIKETFLASGVRIPVTVIQQGFTRHNRKFSIKPRSDVFRIGFLGVPYKRKNLFKLFQACVNLLEKIPGLRLAVHSASNFPGLYTPRCRSLQTPSSNGPGGMTEEWTAEWYGRLSCYVFLEGKGWSFTPRESMYLGIPTVLTDIPVHREIIGSGYCRAIPVCGKEDAYYEGNTYGQWDRVSLNDIEDAVWDVYRNYGSYLIRALQGSRWIENRWTNEGSQQMLLEYMRSL